MVMLLSLFLILLTAAGSVPQPSLLDSVRQKSEEECVAVDYEFTATMSGVKTSGEGKVRIQGNSYHMSGNGLEIYCDSETTWMIDGSAKEVFVESAESQSAGYLANPALLLMNLEQEGKACQVNGDTLTLELDEGVLLEVKIKAMKAEGIKKSEAFRPPIDFDSSWIVTDLR